MGLFGGMLNAMIIANIPPNLPTIAWAATLDPGYHSFSKWAIQQGGDMAKWLGRRTCNLEAPGSSPALTTWICFTVALFSNPILRFVNSQLVCLPPAGIRSKCNNQFV